MSPSPPSPSHAMDDDDSDLDEQIRAQVDEWSSNSNECLTIALVDPTSSASTPIAEPFHPDFTYPIFGEEEAIFGYQDLSINLTFAAHDLRPRVDIQHGQKFQAQGEVRPTDIREALAEFLPAYAFEPRKQALEAASFKPPGEMIHSYTRRSEKFEIWCASLADPQAKRILENMQILVPMFIEGGTILQLEQDWTTRRWKLFLLYQVDEEAHSPHSLVGYGTSYRVFTFSDRQQTQDLASPDTVESLLQPQTSLDPLNLPSRERLSQFLILPPHQHAGHGRTLYNTMYTTLTTPHNIVELTIEDPNEAFDDLRDLADLLHLRTHHPTFAALCINPDAIPTETLASSAPIPTSLIISGETRKTLLQTTKISPRQFDRLVEMHTLSAIPLLHRSRNRITKKEKSTNPHDRAFYLWRLYVKERLYKFNRDQLVQLERNERVERLEAALDGVMEGYAKVLEKVGGLEGRGGGGGGGGGGGAAPRVRKRKVVGGDDDDEEDDQEGRKEDVDMAGAQAQPLSVTTVVNGRDPKKARVS